MKQKIKIALINPPLTGHKYRGTGEYTERLYTALRKTNKINVSLLNIRDNLGFFDLIHYPYFDPFFLTLPLHKQKPTVVTVHDLIPIKFPDNFPAGLRGKIKWWTQKTSLKSCQGIITDSNSSKEDVVRFTGINQDKIKVIYLGIGEQFKVIDSGEQLSKVKNRLKLPDDFILLVGDVNYNKNIRGLIRAFNIIINKYPLLSLVLIGKGFVDPSLQLSDIIQLIKSFRLNDKVHFISHVSTSDLIGIYNLAKVYLQPSYAEGFGLPVLEAMACGCPVVASNCSSLPEIVGDASATVDPYEVQDIANGCLKILSDEKSRNNIIQKGLKRARLFSWEKCAEETLEVYKNILN